MLDDLDGFDRLDFFDDLDGFDWIGLLDDFDGFGGHNRFGGLSDFARRCDLSFELVDQWLTLDGGRVLAGPW